jgi:NAD/NADP transhydrogenase beta subunit
MNFFNNLLHFLHYALAGVFIFVFAGTENILGIRSVADTINYCAQHYLCWWALAVVAAYLTLWFYAENKTTVFFLLLATVVAIFSGWLAIILFFLAVLFYVRHYCVVIH